MLVKWCVVKNFKRHGKPFNKSRRGQMRRAERKFRKASRSIQ